MFTSGFEHLLGRTDSEADSIPTTCEQTIGLRNLKVSRGRWPMTLEKDCQVVSRAVVDPAKWPSLAASAGPHVRRVVRMMAANRPVVDFGGFEKLTEFEYHGPDNAPRLIEVWHR